MATERIALVGAGAIGGVVAAELTDLGHRDLFICTRSPCDPLVVHHGAGTTRIAGHFPSGPGDVSVADWVLLATKAHQTPAARPWLDALCGPATTLVVLQNGVDHVERVAPLLSAGGPVVPVVVQLPAERTAPGRIDQSHPGVLTVPDDPAGRAFARLMHGSRARVVPTDEFATQAWWKLLSNAALGGVCALAIRENRVARDPEVRALVLALMQEIAAVARAEGARLPEDAPDRALDRILAAAPDHWGSIAVDRRAGRPMEWEARNAVVGRLGRRHGIATPLNDAVTALLRVADAGATRR